MCGSRLFRKILHPLLSIFFFSMTRAGNGVQVALKIYQFQYFPSLHAPCLANHSFTITDTDLFK